ncbi:MAG: glycosyltransferase family 2 protein [Synechococcales cyanobacterium RM1_1_8]|nr:glycosyltransferase family 2 protein [Synechococcales cyanobacterium RM1_1_8]
MSFLWILGAGLPPVSVGHGAAFWNSAAVWNGAALVLLLLQLPATALLLSRLLQGPTRRKPLQPRVARASASPASPELAGQVSVIVPTLNEVNRLQPCLDGLRPQGAELREVLVVDSRSQDGTPALVEAAQALDPRLRLITDDPLPSGWVGRPWALHTGFLCSSPESRWLLGIDADTQPHPQLVASLVAEVEAAGYDLVSLAPRFILKSAGEWWLQPALLLTLVYRFGPAGGGNGADRVMANGQCFLIRRSLLTQLNGYHSARDSFCDDVTLARNAAAAGAKVGFWDGSGLIKVRMYEGFRETWREWGRSLDLKDAAQGGQVWGDWALLLLVQGLPLPLLLLGLGAWRAGGLLFWPLALLLGLNGGLLLARLGILGAIAASYDFSQSERLWHGLPVFGRLPASVLFWLSPLADGLAVVRILRSSLARPTQWRGRQYLQRP